MRTQPFRPHLEEVEPRLVPSGGDWHVLVQAGKALAQAGRQEAQVLAGLSDPFCGGQVPGPCADPDLVTLRHNVTDLANDLWSTWLDWSNAVEDARAEVARLQQQQAPFAVIWPAVLHLDYVQARLAQTQLDAEDASGLSAVPDYALKTAAQAMSGRWLDQAGADAQAEKQAERDRVQALRARDFANVQRFERVVTTWQGDFDQQVQDFASFSYFVNR